MKKILLFSLMSVFTATAVNAQHKNIIKIRPLTAVIGNYDVMFERGLGAKTSVALEFAYFSKNVTDIVVEQLKPSGTINEAMIGGYMITPQFRLYFKGNSPKGFYVNAFLQSGKYSVSQTNTDQYAVQSSSSGILNILGGGAGIGYQWQIGMFDIDWNFFGASMQSWTMEFKYELANADNIKNAEDLRDNLNNLSAFDGYAITPSGAGLELKSPFAAYVPNFKTNLSIGVCF